MKKIHKHLTTALLCVSTLFLASCVDDKDNTNPDPDKKPAATTYDVKYTLVDLNSLMQLTDITVSYVDAANKMQSEVIKAAKWEKEIKGITLLYTAKLELKFKIKAGNVYDKSYTIDESHSISRKSSDGKDYAENVTGTKLTIGKDKIETYLQKLEKDGLTYTQDFAKQ